LVPSKGCDPLHDPDAVQVLAFAVDQVRAAELPATICAGATSMLTDTAGGMLLALTMTVMVFAALPPAPLQVSV
jgi:hypothetical protein